MQEAEQKRLQFIEVRETKIQRLEPELHDLESNIKELFVSCLLA